MDVEGLVGQVVTGLGFELVDLESSPKGRLIRVFIDRVPGSITVDDCAAVSNQLSRVFEVENVDYDRLEVSSPGLDRVLKKPSDFVRFVGSEVNLRLRVPTSGGRRNFNGVLLACEDGKLRLAIDTGEVELELGNVDKARLVPKFD